MFIAWGHHGQRRVFANAGDFHCNQCGKEQRSTVVLGYTVRHLWYLFRWTTGKAWHTVCETCGHADRLLNPRTFEAGLSKPPIPFIDRRGWMVGLGCLGALIVLVGVSASIDDKHNLAYLQAPHVNDVYTMDFGRDSSSTQCPDCQYGAAVVSAVNGDGVYIHPSKKIYNRSSDVPWDASPADYVAGETYFISNAQLLDMHKTGKLMDVRR
ncbi:MAG: hypothetical protein QM608_07215 [Caulobacter sp.]